MILSFETMNLHVFKSNQGDSLNIPCGTTRTICWAFFFDLKPELNVLPLMHHINKIKKKNIRNSKKTRRISENYLWPQYDDLKRSHGTTNPIYPNKMKHKFSKNMPTCSEMQLQSWEGRNHMLLNLMCQGCHLIGKKVGALKKQFDSTQCHS